MQICTRRTTNIARSINCLSWASSNWVECARNSIVWPFEFAINKSNACTSAHQRALRRINIPWDSTVTINTWIKLTEELLLKYRRITVELAPNYGRTQWKLTSHANRNIILVNTALTTWGIFPSSFLFVS